MAGNASTLERVLEKGLKLLPYCKYLFILDDQARQITANFSHNGRLNENFGRDRSDRPYLAEALAGEKFPLSNAYISRNARRPSLTAVQHIYSKEGRLLGYLGVDFDLRELRFMDENIYLRAGSLNIFNGMVGLNFSCDGSHYMHWSEFLDKNVGFWLGTSNAEGA